MSILPSRSIFKTVQNFKADQTPEVAASFMHPRMVAASWYDGKIHFLFWECTGTPQPRLKRNMNLAANEDSLLKTKTQLVDYLGEFIEIAIHMILYVREVYPATIFKRVKRFNVPVFVSDFEKLREYVAVLVDTIKPLLFKDNLKQISIVICSGERVALEKFTIALSNLKENIQMAFQSKPEDIEPIDKASLESVLRSFLLKLSTSDSYFRPLPSNTSFYVVISTFGDLSTSTQEHLQDDFSQKFPWVLAGDDQVAAFADSSMIPLKSLESNVFKIDLFAQEINKP